ncbi:hypothetical protein FA10DRAFT_163428 [Acaromyces ingoldii]|uniref:Transmembrane protein n=1 Tax=Acaromyces ingoldii TaxID=215250 RepID=A0A316YFW3_9BASI|nr:hypothetical protein FA10DRAFT_163428 [Acaromyces ingoldii]PWN88440.1 hypothetical protein FA10DRAFT_163428 [Acaromyces ingoldii]
MRPTFAFLALRRCIPFPGARLHSPLLSSQLAMSLIFSLPMFFAFVSRSLLPPPSPLLAVVLLFFYPPLPLSLVHSLEREK